MAKVAAILKEAAEYLSTRPEPLTFTGTAPAAQTGGNTTPTATRRAATGIVPDMTWQGEGVRVGSVQPGSGADKAGLLAGDRLLMLAGIKTPNLRALADALPDFDAAPVLHIVDLRAGGDARFFPAAVFSTPAIQGGQFQRARFWRDRKRARQ